MSTTPHNQHASRPKTGHTKSLSGSAQPAPHVYLPTDYVATQDTLPLLEGTIEFYDLLQTDEVDKKIRNEIRLSQEKLKTLLSSSITLLNEERGRRGELLNDISCYLTVLSAFFERHEERGKTYSHSSILLLGGYRSLHLVVIDILEHLLVYLPSIFGTKKQAKGKKEKPNPNQTPTVTRATESAQPLLSGNTEEELVNEAATAAATAAASSSIINEHSHKRIQVFHSLLRNVTEMAMINPFIFPFTLDNPAISPSPSDPSSPSSTTLFTALHELENIFIVPQASQTVTGKAVDDDGEFLSFRLLSPKALSFPVKRCDYHLGFEFDGELTRYKDQIKAVYCAVSDSISSENKFKRNLIFSSSFIRHTVDETRRNAQFQLTLRNLNIDFISHTWNLLEDPAVEFFHALLSLTGSQLKVEVPLVIEIPWKQRGSKIEGRVKVVKIRYFSLQARRIDRSLHPKTLHQGTFSPPPPPSTLPLNASANVTHSSAPVSPREIISSSSTLPTSSSQKMLTGNQTSNPVNLYQSITSHVKDLFHFGAPIQKASKNQPKSPNSVTSPTPFADNHQPHPPPSSGSEPKQDGPSVAEGAVVVAITAASAALQDNQSSSAGQKAEDTPPAALSPAPLTPVNDTSTSASTASGESSFISVVYHIHGGGFISQTPISHSMYLREWAFRLNVPIISVDYSLSPASAFPVAVEECFEVYKWLLECKNLRKLGIDCKDGDEIRIVITGDSAGGNLAVAVTLKAIEQKVQKPFGAFLHYPAVNLTESLSLSRMVFHNDILLNFHALSICLESYLGKDPNLMSEPLVTALNSDKLKDFPRTFISVGDIDPLLDDSIQLAHSLSQAGVNVSLRVYKGLPHGFLNLTPILMGAKRAVSDSGNTFPLLFMDNHYFSLNTQMLSKHSEYN